MMIIPLSVNATGNLSCDSLPPFNEELLIDIGGDSISSYALIAEGDEPKQTVVLIQGYPGNDNNYDLAQAIRRNGKNAILFNHRGAWGSQGEYSYSNCLEDIEFLIEYFNTDSIANNLRISPNDFTLVGRSLGGGTALIQGSQLDAVQRIVAISPVNYGIIMEGYNGLAELSGFTRYMKKQIMINHNIDAFLQELLDKKDTYNITNYNPALANKEVFIIDNSDRNKDWIDVLDGVYYRILESDHNYIDNRLELINAIIDWLD